MHCDYMFIVRRFSNSSILSFRGRGDHPIGSSVCPNNLYYGAFNLGRIDRFFSVYPAQVRPGNVDILPAFNFQQLIIGLGLLPSGAVCRAMTFPGYQGIIRYRFKLAGETDLNNSERKAFFKACLVISASFSRYSPSSLEVFEPSSEPCRYVNPFFIGKGEYIDFASDGTDVSFRGNQRHRGFFEESSAPESTGNTTGRGIFDIEGTTIYNLFEKWQMAIVYW